MMQCELEALGAKLEASGAKLEALEKDNEVARQQADSGPGSCEDRTRTSVTDSLKRKLKDVMKEFADLREQFRDEHREVKPSLRSG